MMRKDPHLIRWCTTGPREAFSPSAVAVPTAISLVSVIEALRVFVARFRPNPLAAGTLNYAR
jgi:hypothetical protein